MARPVDDDTGRATRPARARPATAVGVLLLVAAVVAATWLLATGGRPTDATTAEERGRVALVEYGCTACHAAPGVRAVNSRVGPPLHGWGERGYIAGILPNTEENLIAWIMAPQEIDPGNAMPDMGVPEIVVRDMAAYLRSFEG